MDNNYKVVCKTQKEKNEVLKIMDEEGIYWKYSGKIASDISGPIRSKLPIVFYVDDNELSYGADESPSALYPVYTAEQYCKRTLKNILKVGMIFETANKNRYLVLEDTEGELYGSRLGGYMDLKTHNEDLTYSANTGLTVMKIYDPRNNICDLEIMLRGMGRPGKLIWERKTVKEITSAEAVELLKDKFPNTELKIKL